MSSPTYYDDNTVCKTDEPALATSRSLRVREVKKSRQTLISKLFPSSTMKENSEIDIKPSTSGSSACQAAVNVTYERTINSVKVVLPVKPYKCQIAVMSKVITAIKESENCLLESPTGTGKTLALLCAALAWQQQEKKRLIKLKEDEAYLRNPVLKDLQNSTAADIASPQKNISELSEIQFVKPIHGDMSIYDVPIEECNFSYAKKRKEMLDDSDESDGLVGNSKKVRTSEDSSNTHPKVHDAEKQKPATDKNITQDGINNQKMLDNLQEQVSMIVGCSLPVIYYGARTHKQLEQVVQEFARTEYAKASPMTILSSRDYSCIRDFDKTLWASKNDMCKGCTKTSPTITNSESNCQYYTNYKELKHSTLPPVFDLKKLISEGKRITACPYYAAKRMGSVAQIVFCPYNYLIEPTIRKNMQIDLDKNIVIVDEGHNIEDVCREAASFTFKQAEIEHALKELQTAKSFRFANKDNLDYIAYLNMALEEWSSWFINQKPLIERQPVSDATAEYVWEVENFVKTLDNHNIGLKQYPDFSKNAKIFCKNVRDDLRQLVGITQSTAILIENMDTAFGYLFRNEGQCIEDYTSVLVRKLRSAVPYTSKSRFNEAAQTESLSLGLLCLNPGVVFAQLGTSRCVLLASGTLTPMSSLLSELDTAFVHTVSPGHVLEKDRVWVGSVRDWQFNSQVVHSPVAQDGLGRVLQRVCEVTPHGVLCFLPSYRVMNILVRRWSTTHLWEKLKKIKEVFKESNSIEDHENIMNNYYRCVGKPRGALLLAVYRGKVAEGMDFKDHQARAVIAVGVPYPSQHTAVKEKMKYNDKYTIDKKLLNGREWFKVQAYRALNQAVGRVVRHARDWGAVLLVDSRYSQLENRQHLATWVQERLGKNHHDYDTLLVGENNLEEFMTRMKSEE